ncbi:MAG: DNA repair exonuclease [Candidatus Pacearchaeota archaeon]
MKFLHTGDCHLGSWRYPELQEINMQSFSIALDFAIKEKVDMVLMAGDIFDSAYPPIEILKRVFKEFKKLHDANIPCFIIAGSHDYSVSGKTFLDVLEHAGFCKNVFSGEERDNKIILHPTIYKNYSLYGYPGMKSGLEINGLKRVKLQDSPGFFKIFMLHTALKEAIGDIEMNSISLDELPKADYYALGHLHVDFGKTNIAYSGPLFPNNFEELEELRYGRFQVVEVLGGIVKRKTIPIKLKEVLTINIKIENSVKGTEKIISEISKYDLKDKIILLRLEGNLQNGRISDIKFNEIESFIKENGAYVVVRNTSKLMTEESNIEFIDIDMNKVENVLIKEYFEKNKSKFSEKALLILKALAIEKNEDEKNQIFEERLLEEVKTIIDF